MQNLIHPSNTVEVAFYEVKNIFMLLTRSATGRSDQINSKRALKDIKVLRAKLDELERVCVQDIADRQVAERQARAADRQYQARLETYLNKNPGERARAERLGMIKIVDTQAEVDPTTPVSVPALDLRENGSVVQMFPTKTLFGFGKNKKRKAA